MPQRVRVSRNLCGFAIRTGVEPVIESAEQAPRGNAAILRRACMNMRTIIGAGALVVSVGFASAAEISGAGATFPYPIYAKWADAYRKETGAGLNYQSIGSGAGIKQIRAKTVTFGATDAPLDPKELDKDGLAQWPMVMGGIVMVVNLP